ncbi:hypothetical protein [Nocardia sp. BMG51109]|uniref:hypothetical protein n=1 Tax=Nocardia sp. BMG51109 TaxID=1056816 RepID=UPI000464F82A|nr:hypothetical protein [Nocardia sp. BMG51109]
MIYLGLLALFLPPGSFVRAIGIFLAVVAFAVGVMIVVTVAEDDSAPTETTDHYPAPADVPGRRACEPFCGAVPSIGARP